MMGNERGQGLWGFRLGWLAVNLLGWSLYTWVAAGAGWLGWQMVQFFREGLWVPILGDGGMQIVYALILFSACQGTILGLLQYVMLKRRLQVTAGWWVLAGIAGVASYAFLPAIVSGWIPYSGAWINLRPLVDKIIAFLTLSVLGIAQWLVLRRQNPSSHWWLVAAALAVIFSLLAKNILLQPQGPFSLAYVVFGGVVDGLIYGVATLVAMEKMAPRSQKT